MVSEHTWENNILDIFLTNSPTLVDSVSVIHGVAYHSAVMSVFRLRPTVQKGNPGTVYLYLEKYETAYAVLSFGQHFSQPVNGNLLNSSGRSSRERLKPSLVGMYQPKH